MKSLSILGIAAGLLFTAACGNVPIKQELRAGAENTTAYLSLLKGKKVGILTNHTATIDNTHLVDSLTALGVEDRKSVV